MEEHQEQEDRRKICQVCGRDHPREYQIVHKTDRGFYREDEKLDLCPECGQAFTDGVQSAVPDSVEKGKNDERGCKPS